MGFYLHLNALVLLILFLFILLGYANILNTLFLIPMWMSARVPNIICSNLGFHESKNIVHMGNSMTFNHVFGKNVSQVLQKQEQCVSG